MAYESLDRTGGINSNERPSLDEIHPGPPPQAAATNETSASETAKLHDVTTRTLRFYEDRGLIRPRRAGRARFYSENDHARLAMILNGKGLGFTLTEIAELIGTPDKKRGAAPDFENHLGPGQISAQLDHLERQRREIEDAIARLRAMHQRQTKAGAE